MAASASAVLRSSSRLASNSSRSYPILAQFHYTLYNAINYILTVSESDRITGAIAGVRAHGYDIVLKLDATIGLAKRDAAAAADAASKLTTQDRRFLESLRIQVDQESFEHDADKRPVARLAMTPQDVRFLKSLRIATDDPE